MRKTSAGCAPLIRKISATTIHDAEIALPAINGVKLKAAATGLPLGQQRPPPSPEDDDDRLAGSSRSVKRCKRIKTER